MPAFSSAHVEAPEWPAGVPTSAGVDWLTVTCRDRRLRVPFGALGKDLVAREEHAGARLVRAPGMATPGGVAVEQLMPNGKRMT